jgi:hypothetical protein
LTLNAAAKLLAPPKDDDDDQLQEVAEIRTCSKIDLIRLIRATRIINEICKGDAEFGGWMQKKYPKPTDPKEKRLDDIWEEIIAERMEEFTEEDWDVVFAGWPGETDKEVFPFDEFKKKFLDDFAREVGHG